MTRAGITLLTVFFAVATIILVSVGVALVHPGTAFDVMWRLKPDREPILMAHRSLLGPFFLGLAVAMAFASYGCATRKHWARWLAIAIFGANGLGDFIQLMTGHVIEGGVGVVAAGLLIFFLTRPSTAEQLDR